MGKKKLRDSRIELLRIISMFLIVLSHFSVFGNWSNKSSLTALQTTRTLLFDALGPAAAICFFLITGYFSNKAGRQIKAQVKKSTNKIKSIWAQTLFYSIGIGLLLYIIQVVPLGIVALAKSFLPVILNQYWFITCYILLILFSPYIGVMIDNLDKVQFKRLVLVLFSLQVPALLGNQIISKFLLAILGYLIGKMIAIEKNQVVNIKGSILLLIGLLIYAFDLLSIFLMRYIGFPLGHSAHFTQYILAVCLAIVLFIAVLKLKPFSNKTVNYISKSVFAVYLITEQPSMRMVLWGPLLNVKQYQNTTLFPLQGIWVVLIIFTVCIVIDMGRRGILRLIRR